MDKEKCCGTCEHSTYDRMTGYVCCNDNSDYLADFVEYEHCCEEYEEYEGK